MIVELQTDIAEEVEEWATLWNVEPDDVVDRYLRKCLMDGRNGVINGEGEDE